MIVIGAAAAAVNIAACNRELTAVESSKFPFFISSYVAVTFGKLLDFYPDSMLTEQCKSEHIRQPPEFVTLQQILFLCTAVFIESLLIPAVAEVINHL